MTLKELNELYESFWETDESAVDNIISYDLDLYDKDYHKEKGGDNLNKKFVLGYATDESYSKIVLILKNRPVHLAGYWMSLGGKIESNETVFEAVSREFAEECGVVTETRDWKLCGIFKYKDDYSISILKTILSEDQFKQVRTMEDQIIGIFNTNELPKNMHPEDLMMIPILKNKNYDNVFVQIDFLGMNIDGTMQ